MRPELHFLVKQNQTTTAKLLTLLKMMFCESSWANVALSSPFLGSVTVLTVTVVHMPEQVLTAKCDWVSNTVLTLKIKNMYVTVSTQTQYKINVISDVKALAICLYNGSKYHDTFHHQGKSEWMFNFTVNYFWKVVTSLIPRVILRALTTVILCFSVAYILNKNGSD